MVADALTKLATSDVIMVLLEAMMGRLPTTVAAHRTCVTPGPHNRGDIAGDGPSSSRALASISKKDLEELDDMDPVWCDVFTVLYRTFRPSHYDRLPEILETKGKRRKMFRAFVREYKLQDEDISRLFAKDVDFEDLDGRIDLMDMPACTRRLERR